MSIQRSDVVRLSSVPTLCLTVYPIQRFPTLIAVTCVYSIQRSDAVSIQRVPTLIAVSTYSIQRPEAVCVFPALRTVCAVSIEAIAYM